MPSVAGGAERVVPKRELCEILQPRAEEMFTLIRDDLAKHGFEEALRGGVVLTGGGAQLDGLLEMAEEIFDAGVRYGLPRGLGRAGRRHQLAELVHRLRAAPLRARPRGRPGDQAQASRGFSVRSMVGSLRGMFEDLL